MAKYESEYAELDREAKARGQLRPGEGGDTLPGAPAEGHAHKTTGVGKTPQEGGQEELMERLEDRIGDDRGSGNLGQGVHVGTPAGGVTQAAETGSSHWGSTRVQDEEDER